MRKELRQQLRIVFGQKRYWFHIAIWSVLTFLTLSESQKVATMVGQSIKINDRRQKVLVDSTEGTLDATRQKMDTEDHDIIYIDTGESKHWGDLKGALDNNNAVLLVHLVMGSILGGIMVYFYLLLVLPYARYKRKRRVLLFGFLINVSIFLLALALTAFISYQITKGEPELILTVKSVVLSTFLMGVVSSIVASYFFAIYYFVDLYNQQDYLNRYKQVITEKLQAESLFLKMQINPHFLFNTLNNIYSLALVGSEDAPNITRRLRGLLKYMIEDCSQAWVPLQGEVRFLSDYIALEQLRNKQESLQIDFQVKGPIDKQEIAPLLLVNFVENAFKHGVKSGLGASFVKVYLSVEKDMLHFEIENSVPEPGNATGNGIVNVGGIGIQNVKRRLEILYPGRHKLSIGKEGKTYRVSLTIQLLNYVP